MCRGYISKLGTCVPPFDKEPNCYPVLTAIFSPTTEVCAETFIAQSNVTDPEIVQQITELNTQLDQACGKFTTPVRL